MAKGPSLKNVLSSRETPDGKKRYGFFDKELAGARKEWAKLTFLTFGLISIFMFLFLSVYFGSYYRQVPRADHYSIEVLDLDSAASPSGQVQHAAILGPAIQNAINNAKQSQPHLGWYEADDATVQNFRLSQNGQGLDAFDYATKKVRDQDVWAVLIVNANATSGVWSALTSGSSWDPTGAITYIYEESRNFYFSDQYGTRLNTKMMTSATSAAATTLAAQVLAENNALNILASAPEGTLAGAFGYNQHNLAPFNQDAGIAATTVGTVYLIIFTFLISISWNNLGLPLIQDKLALGSELLIKILVPFVAYLWLALHYSLVSLAFEVNFTRKYGTRGFPLYWMANWITMSALGFVMETMSLWLGPFFPFFLVFWVIINVTPVFLDFGDMASFYSYGFALPVWNLVDTSKSIIFATKNHLTQNFMVSFGWMVVWMILLAITVAVQRRNKEAEKMKQKWKEMKERDEKVGRGEDRD